MEEHIRSVFVNHIEVTLSHVTCWQCLPSRKQRRVAEVECEVAQSLVEVLS